MKILLIFFTVHLISAAVGDVDVTGYSGRSLLVDSQKNWDENEAKFIKKLQSTKINNRNRYEWINERRFTFLNYYGNVMIYIKELIKQDAGRYRISVGRWWSIYMTLSVKEDSCCNVSKRVMVNSGETASFSCEYFQYADYQKFIFKKGKESITTIYRPWYSNGRLSVSDDKKKNIFSVRITAVTPDDGGVYLCGVWIYNNSYSYSIINTVHLHIMTKVGVSSVSGYSGAGLMIKCEHPQHKTNTKYICKESAGCSGVQEEWMKNGDVSVHNDTRAGVLTVFFRELKAADEGTYRCGVKESEYTERFTQLQLIIKHDAKYPEVLTESVDLGGEVNISCQIPEEQKVQFCKEDDHQSCQIMRASEATPMNPAEPVRVFTVSISNVSVGDAGVYWCEAETRDTHLTFISLNTKIHLILITKVGVSSVSGYSGAGLMIKCEHPQHKTNTKYICKESAGCSGVQEEWMKNGDVSVHNDTRAGVLTVFFRELKAADEGTYRCGVKESEYTERFTQLQLIIKHEAVFKNKTIRLGENVNISCQIPEERDVYFCKEDDGDIYNHTCKNISSSAATQMNPVEPVRVFTVSISNVSVGDAGVYWCGEETRDTHLTFISLKTKIHLILIISPVVRHEGESAEIICPYDSIYKSKSKSLCKGKCSTRDINKKERLTVKEDPSAGVFTGTIAGLTPEDAGNYWCSVTLERELNYLSTDLMVIIKHDLNLTKYEGEHVSINCKHHDGDQKRFCKAHEASMCVKDETIRDDRFSISAGASAGVFTVNITDLRAEDSGLYWCGDHVITQVNLDVKKGVSGRIIIIGSSVLVMLLLTGASVLFLFRWGYIKTRDHSSTETETNCGEASQSACEYENIGHIRQRLSSEPEENILYSTVKYHTDSSDQHNELYSTVQLPTKPSDELLYSTVRFQKHG